MSNKIKLLKFQLSTAVFSLIILLISGFFIFGPELTEMAKALSPNYSKVVGDNLDVGDWNNLDDDFVAKSGDTMSGSLILSGDPTLPMQAATMQYANSAANSIKDYNNLSGPSLKIVCGRTYLVDGVWPVGNTWYYNPADPPDKRFLQVRIDTNLAGFVNPPSYFASLGGAYNYGVYGVNDLNSFSDYFTVRLFLLGTNRDGKDYLGNYISPSTVTNTWHWYLNWCAIGS